MTDTSGMTEERLREIEADNQQLKARKSGYYVTEPDPVPDLCAEVRRLQAENARLMAIADEDESKFYLRYVTNPGQATAEELQAGGTGEDAE